MHDSLAIQKKKKKIYMISTVHYYYSKILEQSSLYCRLSVSVANPPLHN